MDGESHQKDQYQFDILCIEVDGATELDDDHHCRPTELATNSGDWRECTAQRTDDTSRTACQRAVPPPAVPPSGPKFASSHAHCPILAHVRAPFNVTSHRSPHMDHRHTDLSPSECHSAATSAKISASNSLPGHCNSTAKSNLEFTLDCHRHKSHHEQPVDLSVNITLRRRPDRRQAPDSKTESIEKCLPLIGSKMVASSRNENLTIYGLHSKRILFPLILIFSIVALVLLHNG